MIVKYDCEIQLNEHGHLLGRVHGWLCWASRLMALFTPQLRRLQQLHDVHVVAEAKERHCRAEGFSLFAHGFLPTFTGRVFPIICAPCWLLRLLFIYLLFVVVVVVVVVMMMMMMRCCIFGCLSCPSVFLCRHCCWLCRTLLLGFMACRPHREARSVP